MTDSSIFSTYSQNENRVTASLLAVLERVGLDITERILAGATGEVPLELVTFANQPSRGSAGNPGWGDQSPISLPH